MKDLSSVQLDILEFMLRNRSARESRVVKGLGEKPEVIEREISKLIKDGWLEERYRVPDDKFEALGYIMKCQVQLWLNTSAHGRKREFPEAGHPLSLARALVDRLTTEFDKQILVGRLYATYGDRMDASFSLRCKSADNQESIRQFLEKLPGVHRVEVYRETLIL